MRGGDNLVELRHLGDKNGVRTGIAGIRRVGGDYTYTVKKTEVGIGRDGSENNSAGDPGNLPDVDRIGELSEGVGKLSLEHITE